MRHASPTPLVLTLTLTLLAGCTADHADTSLLTPRKDTLADTYTTTLAVLEEVVPLTFHAVHWGPMQNRLNGGTLYATAALPNGMTAEVIASPEPADFDRVHVDIKVGRFGHEEHERQFLDELHTQLRKHAERQ